MIRLAQFIGKAVSLLLLTVVAVGIVTLFVASMVGCAPNWGTPTTYLVKTLAGNYCVDANYKIEDGAGCFRFISVTPQGKREETNFCSVVQITVADKYAQCRAIPPILPEAQ